MTHVRFLDTIVSHVGYTTIKQNDQDYLRKHAERGIPVQSNRIMIGSSDGAGQSVIAFVTLMMSLNLTYFESRRFDEPNRPVSRELNLL